jgi:predicted ATPase
MISSQYVSRITLRRDKVESFDRYPFSLPVVRSLEQIDLHPHVNFFVGDNGSGKSTLLEAIAVSLGFNAEGGSKNFSFGTRASHSDLHRYLRIAKGLRRPGTVTSCARRASSMWLPKSRSWTKTPWVVRRSSAHTAAARCTNSRMANPSWP